MNVEIEQGLRGTCGGCPFNDGITTEASLAQNYGCLPTGYDIIKMKRESGHNWACHDDESKVCAGLCHSSKDAQLDLSTGGLVRYSSWYHAGEAAALEEARTGLLVQKLTGRYFDLTHQGETLASGTRQEPSHLRPALKYWEPLSAFHFLRGKEDSRVFFTVSSAPAPDDESGLLLRRFVGILEVETSPYDASIVWLKYLTVAPSHQRQGLAIRLLRMCIDHVRESGQRLELSRPGEGSPPEFHVAVERELKASGIRWHRSGDKL